MLYKEKGASGYSNKNFITKAGGAHGVLNIYLSEEELHLITSIFFKPFAVLYDCYHKIPLRNISKVTMDRSRIVVDFMKNGKSKQMVIKSRRPSELFEKLSNQHKINQSLH